MVSETESSGKIILGVLKEPGSDNRVAMLPTAIKDLNKLGISLLIETDAGNRAFASDEVYMEAGAKIGSMQEVLDGADILLRINPPADLEIDTFPEGKIWISLMQPTENPELIEKLKKRDYTVLALDAIPRISRAQTMDVLSSQANLAGYKAALLAASSLPGFFPMMTTAAGSIPPSKALILGAGVAGLQAIATCRRLGAVVEAFDVRSAVKEEVESLGAKFIEVEGADEKDAGGYAVEQTEEFRKKQQAKIDEHVQKADVIITTAQIPGKKAPCLISAESFQKIRPGSVLIDLAASTGGNCEVTENNKTIVKNGVTIIGNSNLPSTMPRDASMMYGKNVISFLKLLIDQGNIKVNMEDAIIEGCCITHKGEMQKTN